MSNTETENLIVRIVTEMLEIVKGQEAPFNYSTIVAQLKNKFPNFPKELGMKKSAEFVDYLVSKDLVSKAYPKGETVLYIQPVKSMNTWIKYLTSYEVDEELFYADVDKIPSVEFKNWMSFIDFLDIYKDIPRFKGNVNSLSTEYEEEHFYWIVNTGVCYYVEALDFPSITSIREVIGFGMRYQHTIEEFVEEVIFDPNVILRRHEKFGKEFSDLHWNIDGYGSSLKEHSLELKMYSPYENYKTLIGAGFSHISDFIQAKEIGIFDKELLKLYNSDDFSSLGHEDTIFAIAGGYENADTFEKGLNSGFLLESEFKACTEGGFSDATEYRDALDSGFKSVMEYREANKLNYPDYDDYIAGKKGGFKNYDEYNEAQEGEFSGAEDYREAQKLEIWYYDEYKDWVADRQNRTIQAKPSIMKLLKDLKDDMHTIEKILDYIKNKNPSITESDLVYFFENDPDVLKQGSYKADFKSFQMGKLLLNGSNEFNNNKTQTIVIDGNNVAYENRKNKEKAKINNLKILMNELRSKGFDFLLFVKPTLRYNIDDEDEFNELIAQGVVKQTPGGEEDDEFILKHAIKTNSKVISNDMYRDYQKQNPNLKNKIQELRLSFSINDGIITFGPGLDDWLKRPEK